METFYVNQSSLFSSATFDIHTDRGPLGFVRRKLFTLKLYDYEFFDNNSNLQAEAFIRWLGVGAKFDVQDVQQNSLGMIQERLLCFYPTYDFYSPDEELIATAEMNFWHTEYTISDPATQTILGKITRPYFSLYNQWTLSLNSLQTIDARLLIFLAVFHSDREFMEKKKKQEENKKKY